MSRSFISVLAFLTLAGPLAAQQRGGPPQSGKGLLTGIRLTAAQQKRVDSLWVAHTPRRDSMRAMMQSGQRPDSAQRAAMSAARDENAKEIRVILTPEQQKVFEKNVEEMRARMGGGMGAGTGGPPDGPPN